MPLSGFLVVAKCRFSDRPLRLFNNRGAAEQFARSVREPDAHDGPKLEEGCTGRCEDGTLGVVSSTLFVGLIEFTDGMPGSFEPVQSFVRPRKPAIAAETA